MAVSATRPATRVDARTAWRRTACRSDVRSHEARSASAATKYTSPAGTHITNPPICWSSSADRPQNGAVAS
jgi:hypothetical protein